MCPAADLWAQSGKELFGAKIEGCGERPDGHIDEQFSAAVVGKVHGAGDDYGVDLSYSRAS